MRLKTSCSLIDFLNQIKKCKSDVYFRTVEGDNLNLKSLLSEYIFLSLTSDSDILQNGQVICESDKDYKVLEDFIIL